MEQLHTEWAPALGQTPISVKMNSQIGESAFSEIPVTSVDEFSSPDLGPLAYPGLRPEYAFTISEGQVLPINAIETPNGVQFGINTEEGVFDLNDLLRQHGVVSMEDRIPVVGFGSNASPERLREKFSQEQNKWGDTTEPGNFHVVPTLRGTMKDVAVAYSSKIGIRGCFFAELIEATDTETEVFINFLSPGQLARMVRSEGAYELCDLGSVDIDGLERSITAYGFAGKNEVLLDATGKPILLDSVKSTNTELSSMSEVAVMNMVAQEFGAQLDDQYPNAPVFANSASNLMAYVSYRVEFLRREDQRVTKYKHHPVDGEASDPLVGLTLQDILRTAGRVAESKVLDNLDVDKRNVVPQTFGELYNQVGKV